MKMLVFSIQYLLMAMIAHDSWQKMHYEVE